MNVDENRDIPAKFGIRGIPTLMFSKMDNWQRQSWRIKKAQLTAFIDQQMA